MYLLKLELLVRVSRYLLVKGRSVYKGVVSSLITLYFRRVDHFVLLCHNTVSQQFVVVFTSPLRRNGRPIVPQ
jgi:hypothetical protein